MTFFLSAVFASCGMASTESRTAFAGELVLKIPGMMLLGVGILAIRSLI
jgi:hypothetical protein